MTFVFLIAFSWHLNAAMVFADIEIHGINAMVDFSPFGYSPDFQDLTLRLTFSPDELSAGESVSIHYPITMLLNAVVAVSADTSSVSNIAFNIDDIFIDQDNLALISFFSPVSVSSIQVFSSSAVVPLPTASILFGTAMVLLGSMSRANKSFGKIGGS